MCLEAEATHKVSIIGYRGNSAEYRCDRCTESFKKSFGKGVKVEKIEEES